MFLKLFLFLLPVFLFSAEVVWDGDGGINEEEYQQAIKEYVDLKYPAEAKDWNEKVEREKVIKENTVTLNGLMWQDEPYIEKEKDAYDNNYVYGKVNDWSGAKEYCENLSLNGYTDWYLPSKGQLEDLYSKKNKLRHVMPSFYWSSSLSVSDSKDAWSVYFNPGYSGYDGKTHERYVRCARAGQ